MKKQFKKIGMVALLLTFGLTSVYGQKDASQKSNVLGIGASANFYYGFGGNISYFRMISPKIGIGARVVYVPLSYDDYHGETLHFTNGKGNYSDISIGLNYYFLNSEENKFGLYSGVGIGFISDKSTQNIRFTESNTPFTNTETMSGLSGNLTLGASYKMGPGKIFLEFMPSSVLSGKNKDTYDFPAGSLIDKNGDAIEPGFSNYEYKVSFPTTMTLTLGYQLKF